jgi:hypothetical protein
LGEQLGCDPSVEVRRAIELAAGRTNTPTPTRPTLPVVDTQAPLPEAVAERLLTANRWGGGRLVINLVTGQVEPNADAPLTHLSECASGDEVSPVHVARALLADKAHEYRLGRIGSFVQASGVTPLEIQAVAQADGISPTTLVDFVAWSLDGRVTSLWRRQDIEEWIAFDPEAVLRSLQTVPEWHTSAAGRVQAALLVPRTPDVLDRLVRVGLTGLKAYRQLVREGLGGDVVDLVTAELTSRRVGDRVEAAAWLRQLADPGTEPALRSAIDRENDDLAKATMLAALEALGASLEEYLAPQRLLADARASLAGRGGRPKDLDWLDPTSLPTLTWADGTPVEPEVVTWFLATAVKAKSSEPSPLLRMHVARMDQRAAHAFGEALLTAWIAQDTAPMSYQECEQAARTEAAAIKQHSWHPSHTLPLEEVTAQCLRRLLNQPAGSAVGSKGLLAVVAATAGPEVSAPTLSYLRRYRGSRLHQAKALIGMLGWVDHPAATQVLLVVSQRFRPASLQTEAAAKAQELAERKGWTVDDLADRSVPTGGFDEAGRLVIEYGEQGRTFTARLTDELKVTLVNDGTGKPIATLPPPRADEDADAVKAAKADLAATRKEVTATGKLQPVRLYQAMCLQRAWPAEDFQRYLLHHPLLARLVHRLVWTVIGPDGVAGTFRPLTDGTLIDFDDEEVVLPPSATVGLAHDELVAPEVASAWQRHLRDYEVAPLFGQFGRPALPVLPAQATEITDFAGHLIEERVIKGQLSRLGWQLGMAGDGGIIDTAVKPMPSHGIQVRLLMSYGVPASSLGVAWRTAVGTLAFYPTGAQTPAMPLSDVPRVLLRESYAEVCEIAAAGTGFDPDWEKKVG